ncbi:MAG: regulatory protein RecX [Clostridia bacterium]|jgi:regulatory protein|nr:regulatory protein RecX [Clostridia bacterium]MBR0436534.1 regulatory protein RecX [Clostridia bacterium]MBR2644018.1 regulatory protein RecX [Clostridia bacterium]MBR3038991.1 regulatory protein RecX [Clostridia bacterium]MBR3129994.1 regulatory protein RecX [Clostridia bacterium]
MKKQTTGSMSPMDYAMKYLTAKDRTVSEMQAYLDEKDFGEADVDATVERLKELGLLDDRRYAQRYVETRLNTKPVSRRHLYEQMKGHGLPEEYIREAMEYADTDTERENALAVARKFARQFAALEPEKRRMRVLSRLQARGYSYDTARSALETALSEEDEWSES